MKLLVSLTTSILLFSFAASDAFLQKPNTVRRTLALNTIATAVMPFNMTQHSTPLNSAESSIKEFPEESLQYDNYSGVAIHANELKGNILSNPVVFAQVLESSLELWKMEQRRGIWIHIPKSHGHLIAVRIKSMLVCNVVNERTHSHVHSLYVTAFVGCWF